MHLTWADGIDAAGKGLEIIGPNISRSSSFRTGAGVMVLPFVTEESAGPSYIFWVKKKLSQIDNCEAYTHSMEVH